jgi:hypothetical protein
VGHNKTSGSFGINIIIRSAARGRYNKLVAAWDRLRISGVPTFEGPLPTVEETWRHNKTVGSSLGYIVIPLELPNLRTGNG